jgi:chemotaxis signal transduction protein
MTPGGENSYVLFPLGEKRFAVPAAVVTELARPDNLQTFPHRTPLLAGVLVRRGRIVPVCDVAQMLVGPDAPPRKFYLIANCMVGSRQEFTAIPVTGECELASLRPSQASGSEPPYVKGVLHTDSESIDIVDLEKLVSIEVVS